MSRGAEAPAIHTRLASNLLSCSAAASCLLLEGSRGVAARCTQASRPQGPAGTSCLAAASPCSLLGGAVAAVVEGVVAPPREGDHVAAAIPEADGDRCPVAALLQRLEAPVQQGTAAGREGACVQEGAIEVR